MAVLQQNTGGGGGNPALATDAVAGQRYPARIIAVLDQYQVERKKYQSEEMELRDVSQFFFAVHEGEDIKFLKTWEMKQSTDSRSKLWQFLTGVLGHEPTLGWDYANLEGSECLVLVQHRESRMGIPYSVVEAAKPIKEDGLYDLTGRAPEMHHPSVRERVKAIREVGAPPVPAKSSQLADDWNASQPVAPVKDTIDLDEINF